MPFALPRPLLTVLLTVAATATVLAGPVGPQRAAAFGVAYDTTVLRERAVVSLVDGQQEIVLSLDLAASPRAGRAAIVVPVPATPTVTPLTAVQAPIFAQLERATAPLRAAPPSSSSDAPPAASVPADRAVEVLSRGTISGYDVARLRARGGANLPAWLNRHGYRTPATAGPILRDYVARGWSFVAIRLPSGPRPAQATQPLVIRFPSARLIFPLRLAAASPRPVSLDLYVNGEHRVIAKGFDTYHAGFVSDLRPAPTAAVAALLPGRYLTRLGRRNVDPGTIVADVQPRRAVSDRLFRASTGYPYESEEGFATAPRPAQLQPHKTDLPGAPGPAAWLLLFPVVAVMIGGVALLLRRPWRRG